MSLRPTVFVTNFFGMWAPQIKAGDVVCGPHAAASTAPIVDADISAVAAHALLRDDLLARKVPLTGPQDLTNTELVDVIGVVLGRPLRYQEVPPDLVRARFIGLGFSAQFADAYTAMLEATVSEPALVTHEVEKILGRAPHTFGDAISLTAPCSAISKGHDMSELRPPRYLKSMNRIVKAMQRMGVRTGPAMILTVPGRKTGKPRSTPMTPFTYRGDLYTVAGYPGADWAANARAAGAGTLSRGRKSREIRIVELNAAESRPILREFPVQVPVGVGFAKRSGLVREGTPDEFEALAGQLVVFRFDPAV